MAEKSDFASRDDLLQEVLNLENKNFYKNQIVSILRKKEAGEVNEIEAYIFVNNILAAYDLNVLIPLEEKEIREKRKKEVEKANEISCVSIQDENDKTEVAIKTKTEIGQIFLNGFKEFYRTIGIENLCMTSKNGVLITDEKYLSGGKQKNKAKEIVKQYVEIIERPDLKRYAIQETDIFEIPLLIDYEDGRGKSGFFKDRIIPIMIQYLLWQGDINTTVDKLSIATGIVGNKFKDSDYEKELLEKNNNITISRISKFYSFCRPEQERIIFNGLNVLQDDYSAITYYKNFRIKDNSGNIHTSSRDEDIIIRKSQRKVLDEFGVNRIFQIYQKRIQKKYYERVIDYIKENYGFEWSEYYQQIQIFADMDALRDLSIKYSVEEIDIENMKTEIMQRFIYKIGKKIESDYIYTQNKAVEFENKQKADWNDNDDFRKNIKKDIPQDIQDMIDGGVYDYESIKKFLPKPYRYPDNHIEIMNNISNALLSNG